MRPQRSIPKEDTEISHCGPRSPKYIELGHFTLLFAEDGKEMYKDSKRTCTAIVLLIKTFVWRRSRCRRRRGVLKLPNDGDGGQGGGSGGGEGGGGGGGGEGNDGAGRGRTFGK